MVHKEHKCNSCFYMESPKEAWPCNTCEGYNKYVNRNIYINQPDTVAIRKWDAEDAFNEQKTWKVSATTDVVNAPKHYMLFEDKGIEVRHVLAKLAEKISGASGIPDSPLFTSDYVQMMQYFMRFMEKNGKEDLEKGQWFLNKVLASYERYNT